METSMYFPPPPSATPVSYLSPQQETPMREGVSRLGKTKAIRAIRSILGLFNKPGRRKSEDKIEELPMKIDLPTIGKREQFYPISRARDSSDNEDMSASETNDKENSDFNNCLDEFPNANTAHNVVKNDIYDGLPKAGNFHDEFQHSMKVQANGSVTSDGDVFLNESYFEDDYFEDFSSGSSPADIECSLFTSPKKIRFRAMSCDCQRDIDVMVFKDISKSARRETRRRHVSMPCLIDLALEPAESVDSDQAKNVDHLLQAPASFFTLGMDMITDHFGIATNEPEALENGKAQQASNECEETKSISPEESSLYKMCPLSCNNETIGKGAHDHAKTPVKQRLSLVKDERYTPIAPFKKKPGENDHEMSQFHSASPRTYLRSRKNLYKENRLSPNKINDSSDNEKRIADGLSAVADWVMHVVAIGGSNDEQDAISDSETKNCIAKGITVVPQSNRCGDTEFNPSIPKCVLKSKENPVIFLKPFSKRLEIPPASKEVNTDVKGKGLKFGHPHKFGTEHRPRLESGYCSRSRCSTPATPLSEPATPMSKLKSGRVMSPYSRNKLDGLTPRLNPVKVQSQGMPKFLFPPIQSFPPLKTVEELIENPCDSSGIAEKSSQSMDTGGGFSDVILSGGGDVDSLVTSSLNVESPCSSSGSVFWPASSITSRDHNFIYINVIDENNNLIQRSLFPRVAEEELPEISSPVIKKLQPISTSSPLQVFGSDICVVSPIPLHEESSEKNTQRKNHIEMSSIQTQGQKNDVINSTGHALSGKESKSTLQVPPAKKRKSLNSRSARTARTCLRFEDSHGDAKSRPSEDYLILKRVVKFIVRLGRPNIHIKPHMDTPALMGNLKGNYHRIIRDRETYKGIQLVSQLRQAIETTQNSDALTIENSVDQFLLNLLIARREATLTCADFIFQNLQSVVRKNTAFFSLAPELVALLLSNDHCIVKGPNGFPLPYRASEKEVLKVAVKVVEKCNRENPQNSRVQRLLYQVVDPKVVLKDVFSEMAKLGKETTTLSVPRTPPPRTNHRISYHQSDCTPACDSRHMLTASKPASCAARSEDERATLYELKKNGTINTEAPVDARTVCNEEHFLRTVYFCYGSFKGVPYIADIGMQYVYKGKKKTLFLAAPPTTNIESQDSRPSRRSQVTNSRSRLTRSSSEDTAEGLSSEDVANSSPDVEAERSRVQAPSYPVSEPPHPFPLKKAAMVLAPGEHITAVAVLGNSDIHNIEVVTNTKRRVRAHGLPALPDAKWTRIRSPPSEGAPVCLHALIGETRTTPTEGTRLCNMGALWAVTSWTPNDLNR